MFVDWFDCTPGGSKVRSPDTKDKMFCFASAANIVHYLEVLIISIAKMYFPVLEFY
jgi:hypothetical protein